MWNENAQTVRQHHRKLKPHVTKKQATYEDRMISSNNYNLCVKCYLKFVKIVADRMQSFNVLATANDEY